MDVIVGASSTAVTVKTKVSLAVSDPSETVSVIVEVPLAFATGVMVTVQLVDAPAITMAPLATTDVLLELAETADVHTKDESISAMVNAMAPVATSSVVD